MAQSLCHFHTSKGGCFKGDECTFSHDGEPPVPSSRERFSSNDANRFDDLRPDQAAKIKAALHKTRICNHYLDNKCYRGDKCSFLHVSGPDAFSLIYSLNKLKECPWRKYAGDCTSGKACGFSHGSGAYSGALGSKTSSSGYSSQNWRKTEKSDAIGDRSGPIDSRNEAAGVASHTAAQQSRVELEASGQATEREVIDSKGGDAPKAPPSHHDSDLVVIDMASADAAAQLDKLLLE